MAESAILRREREFLRKRMARLHQAREEESQAYLAHGRGSPQQLAAADNVERRKTAMVSAARSVGAIERSEYGREKTDVGSVERQTEEDDPRSEKGGSHQVAAYRKDDGEHVGAHMARNPRKRR